MRYTPSGKYPVTGCGVCPLFCGQYGFGVCEITTQKVSESYPNHELDNTIHPSCPLPESPKEKFDTRRIMPELSPIEEMRYRRDVLYKPRPL